MGIYNYNNFLLNEKFRDSELRQFYNRLLKLPEKFPNVYEMISNEDYNNTLENVKFELIEKEKDMDKDKKEERIQRLEKELEQIEEELSDYFEKYINIKYQDKEKKPYSVLFDISDLKVYFKEYNNDNTYENVKETGKSLEIDLLDNFEMEDLEDFDTIFIKNIDIPVDLSDEEYNDFFITLIKNIYEDENPTQILGRIKELNKRYDEIQDKIENKETDINMYEDDDEGVITEFIDYLLPHRLSDEYLDDEEKSGYHFTFGFRSEKDMLDSLEAARQYLKGDI